MAISTEHNLETQDTSHNLRRYSLLIVILFAAAVYLGCIVSPPSLMDDSDSVQALIARTMLHSGDWVTAKLDGIAFLEKPPLVYWTMAASFKVFGAHDWVARIPIALSAIGLCWLTAAFGMWAFGKRAGFYAGLCMATCVGLFLFTRILLPDVMLTLCIAIAMWSILRALDDEEKRPELWPVLLGISMGLGLLLKSLIAIVFPAGAALVYLLLTKQLFVARTWRRLRPFRAALIALAIAVPWHVLAALRNPPFFAFTLHSGPGQYHGFLWFYFINEQLLRFLNLRYPRDYNTVPRLYFWLFHLIWLFPWSVYLPAAAKLSFKPLDRAGRARLMALCWLGFILVFFTFSTTQEYYSMPAYPAFALLIGSAIAVGGSWIKAGTKVLGGICALAAIAAIAILIHVRGVPTPGDISSALSHHPSAYTLSLGHMEDLTLESFAYLRIPLLVAAIAFLLGAFGAFFLKGEKAILVAALMMVLFFHAARLAMVTFDPFLSSRPLANKLLEEPEGTLITQGFVFQFSSVFFYTDRGAYLYSTRRANLEYGSNAPGAAHVFINDSELQSLWAADGRCYLLTFRADLPRYQDLLGADHLDPIMTSGGKVLLTNHPLLLSRQANAMRFLASK
jgi:4-amino-4-deoxy-L-arabinose transferase-like glycosyltransferase